MDSELLIQANSALVKLELFQEHLMKLSYFSNLEFTEYLAVKIT